jgi:hypothetical protein
MSAKKRNSSKNSSKSKTRRQGVSGNPQRREQAPRPDPAARAMAFRMAGGADPAPWWPESHQRVIARARAESWPPDPVGTEDLTARIVGGELHERLRRHRDGHQFAQWLVALTEAAGAALAASLDSGDWRGLASLLRGIALTAPRPPAYDEADGSTRLARHFPSIQDPYGTALAETAQAAKLLAERGLDAEPGLSPDSGTALRPAGAPLVARDSYGSRFLLAAPFTYESVSAGTHWYAWDIDACWIDEVVAAGAFGSPGEALADWRGAVGPRAAGADLEGCPPDLAVRLLRQPLETGPFAEYVKGDEPAELMREYYRQRRRAREVSASVLRGRQPAAAFVVDMDAERDAFLEWYARQHGREAVTAGMAEAVDTITDQWGPHKDVDDPVFFACSPHRIQTAARLIRNGHYGEHATPAIRLLPEWTRWCAERGGIDGGTAALAVEAARSAAAALDGATAAVPDHADPGPFRKPE